MFLKDVALVLLGSVLTLIVERILYRWQKRDERREGPNVVIARVLKENLILLDIRNIGNDSLSEMEVTIAWAHKGQPQERTLEHFIAPDQGAYATAPVHVEVLGTSERYNVLDLPQSADGGIVAVTVTGVGV